MYAADRGAAICTRTSAECLASYLRVFLVAALAPCRLKMHRLSSRGEALI
jgi:hypothetical protein